MKDFIYFLLIIFPLLFSSCEKYGDIDTELKGKTFVYHNGEYGDFLIRKTYTFESNGNVYYKSEVGTVSPFDTKGSDLYYEMNDAKFIIYHGTKGWKKNVRHTEYSRGEYFVNYIIVDGDKYDIQKTD